MKNLIIIQATALLLSACGTNGTSAQNQDNTLEAPQGYEINMIRQFVIHAGRATIKFNEYSICPGPGFLCEEAVLVLDKNDKVISRANYAQSEIKPVSTGALKNKKPTESTQHYENVIDIDTTKENFKKLSAQALGLCRTTSTWNSLYDIARSERKAIYFHFSNDKFDNLKTQYRVTSDSEEVTAVPTRYAGPESLTKEPKVIFNAIDETGNFLLDNAYIRFDYHRVTCAGNYESLRKNTIFYDRDVDGHASRYTDQDSMYERKDFKPHGIEIPIGYSVDGLSTIKPDPQDRSARLNTLN